MVRDIPNRRETRLTLPPVSSHVFFIKTQLSFRTGELQHEMHGVNSSDVSCVPPDSAEARMIGPSALASSI